MHRFAAGLLLFVAAAVLTPDAFLASPIPQHPNAEGAFRVTVLSARPDMISGGDARVRIEVPRDVPLNTVVALLNGGAVQLANFRPDDSAHALEGVVSALRDGDNTFVVGSARRHPTLFPVKNANDGLTVTLHNYPITGPIFSGPHERPFVCESQSFPIYGNTMGMLGPAVDENCTVVRRVDYFFRSVTTGRLVPLAWLSLKPSDLATGTTADGRQIPHIVQIETGTINRGIYQIAIPYDPVADRGAQLAGWNGRLIYTFGGGCNGGWYRQGANTGGVDDPVMLARGYAIASSSLNVFGNNCNDLLAAETMMMVKERFIEVFGRPHFTIGWGCSGGSYQVNQIADNYPGLLDGIIVGCGFPDLVSGMMPKVTDARLLRNYFEQRASVPYSDEQKRRVAGFLLLNTLGWVGGWNAGRVNATEHCPPGLPQNQRYHPTANRTGARCDVYDHAVNVYGRDPRTGFVRRPLDNVGIQYGLRALNDGVISAEQFLDLNETVGGFDEDGAVGPARTVGDREAIRIAYRSGRLLNGGGGLAFTPVIDYRGYADDNPVGDPHLRYHSFSAKARLKKVNGHSDSYVMLTEGRTHGLFSTSSPVLSDALVQMDVWLTNLMADLRAEAMIAKVRRARPADLRDSCWTRDEKATRILEPQERTGRCATLYPDASFPREVAGAGIESDIIKCELKPIDPTEYRSPLSAEQITRLRRIFPEGVCDWSKIGVEQQPLAGTWLRF